MRISINRHASDTESVRVQQNQLCLVAFPEWFDETQKKFQLHDTLENNNFDLDGAKINSAM